MGQLPFRWIMFDAVGTLIVPEPSVSLVYHEAARRHGRSVPPATIAARFREIMGRRVALRTSESEEHDFWQRTVTQVIGSTQNDDQCFEEIYAHFAQPEHWRLKPGAAELLDDLSRQGYSLGVASNFDSRLHRVLDGTPALQSLTRRLISSEIGWRKPSPQFFQIMVGTLDVVPSQVLMVGDDLALDIGPALEEGISAVHLADEPCEHVPVREPACRSRTISRLVELPSLLKDWHAD